MRWEDNLDIKESKLLLRIAKKYAFIERSYRCRLIGEGHPVTHTYGIKSRQFGR